MTTNEASCSPEQDRRRERHGGPNETKMAGARRGMNGVLPALARVGSNRACESSVVRASVSSKSGVLNKLRLPPAESSKSLDYNEISVRLRPLSCCGCGPQ